MDLQVGDPVYLVTRYGYTESLTKGTVTRLLPARGGAPGQLQDEIEVRLGDGRICGGPLGYFRKQEG